MTRPGPPGPAGRGLRWVPAVAEDAEVIVADDWLDQKCSRRTPGRELHNQSPCNAQAVAVLHPGGNRCPNHLDGRWVEHGIVMRWELEPTEEEER